MQYSFENSKSPERGSERALINIYDSFQHCRRCQTDAALECLAQAKRACSDVLH